MSRTTNRRTMYGLSAVLVVSSVVSICLSDNLVELIPALIVGVISLYILRTTKL